MSGGTSGTGRSWAPRISLTKAISLSVWGLVFLAPLIGVMQGASINDLAQVLTDPFVLKVIANTFSQAALSTLPAVLVALPLAYFFARYEFRLSSLGRAVVLAPFFAPAFAAAEAFLIMYGRNGVVNSLLMQIFQLAEPPLKLLYSLQAVVLAHVFYYVPVAFVALEAGFASIDQELIDASKSLGASEWRTFRKVMLPQLVPSLVASAILIFIFSFLTFATPLLIGGSFTTLEVQIYYYWTKFGGWTTAKTLSTLQLGLNLLFIVAIFQIRERVFQPRMVAKTGGLRRDHLNLLRQGARVKALTLYAVAVLAFEALPIYFIFASGFAQSYYLIFPISPSLENFQNLFNFDFGTKVTVWDSMGQSIAIAAVAALLSVSASLTTAYSIAHSKRRARSLLSAATSAPLAVSRVALAAGLYSVYGAGIAHLYGRWELLAIAHVLLIYPLTTRFIESALIRVDPDLVDASQTSGASRFYTFLRVELPIVGPSIAAASLIAFSSSLGEFTFAQVFTAGSLQTMPVSVEMLIDFRQIGLAAAMTSLILAVIFVSAFAASLLAKRQLGGLAYGA